MSSLSEWDFGAYDPMVRWTEGLVSSDPTDKKIGLPDPGTTESVYMLNVLPGRIRELYSGKAYLKEQDSYTLRKTRKCLPVGQGEYTQLIEKL